MSEENPFLILEQGNIEESEKEHMFDVIGKFVGHEENQYSKARGKILDSNFISKHNHPIVSLLQAVEKHNIDIKSENLLRYKALTPIYRELSHLIKNITFKVSQKNVQTLEQDEFNSFFIELKRIESHIHQTKQFIMSMLSQADIAYNLQKKYDSEFNKDLNIYQMLIAKSISASYKVELDKIISDKKNIIKWLNIGIWVLALVLGGFAIGSYLGVSVKKAYFLCEWFPYFDLTYRQTAFDINFLYQSCAKFISASPFIFLIFLMVRQLRKEEILCEGYRYKASTIALLKVKELELSDTVRDEKFAQILLHNPLDVLNDDTPKLSLEDIKNMKLIVKQ